MYDGNNWVILDDVPDWVAKYQDRIYSKYGGGTSSLHKMVFYLWGSKFIYKFQFVGMGGVVRTVARRPKVIEDSYNLYDLQFLNAKTFPRDD